MMTMVYFRCLKKGLCCIKYWIPVTHLDLFRLEMYGGIDVVSVVRLVNSRVFRAQGKVPRIRFRGEEHYLALRSRSNRACIFLTKSGKCSVHPFKPLVCRFYPFVYSVKGNGAIEIKVNEDAAKECPGLILDGKPIERELELKLVRLAKVRIRELELYGKAVEEWNWELYSEHSRIDDLLEFLLNEAKKHYLILKIEGMWIK